MNGVKLNDLFRFFYRRRYPIKVTATVTFEVLKWLLVTNSVAFAEK